MHRLIGGLLLAVGLALPACQGTAHAAEPAVVIRITTGLPGMTFKPLGEALAQAFASVMSDVRFDVIETPGSVANLQRLESGEADLGFALADVAYTAFNGRGTDFPTPAQKIRGVAVSTPPQCMSWFPHIHKPNRLRISAGVLVWGRPAAERR